jgi:hypothetical protein
VGGVKYFGGRGVRRGKKYIKTMDLLCVSNHSKSMVLICLSPTLLVCMRRVFLAECLDN